MSTSLSSVISLLKLPREVVENVLILTSCLWLGTGWKCSRKWNKTKKEGAVSSTCANIFPQHLSSSKLAKKASSGAVSSLSPQSSGSSSESRRSLSDSWSVLLVLVASSSSSELPSQDVWNSLISSLNLWDTSLAVLLPSF